MEDCFCKIVSIGHWIIIFVISFNLSHSMWRGKVDSWKEFCMSPFIPLIKWIRFQWCFSIYFIIIKRARDKGKVSRFDCPPQSKCSITAVKWILLMLLTFVQGTIKGLQMIVLLIKPSSASNTVFTLGV